MKKHLLLLGLTFVIAQPAFSQGGCPLGGCPVPNQVQPMRQSTQQIYQQPLAQSRVYQQATPYMSAYQQPLAQSKVYRQATPYMPAYQQPLAQSKVYRQATPYMPTYQAAQFVNPYYPQRTLYYNYASPQGFTGAAAPICQQPKSGWRAFVEDYLGFD